MFVSSKAGRHFAIFLTFVSWASAAVGQAVTPVENVTMIRDSDYSRLPVFEIKNPTQASATVTIASSLEDASGKLWRQATATYGIQPKTTSVIPAYQDKAMAALKDDIALLRVTITLSISPDSPVTHTAIVGTPRPVARDGDYFIGMNAALHRYTAEEQWRMLRLMREAGVTTVRVEPGFHLPDPKTGGYKTLNVRNVEQCVLAAEAYGIKCLFLLSYFPKGFNEAPDKAKLAHDWAYSISNYFKGRVHDWQFGNETNVGWGAFGAAADMAIHHKAMSLGVLKADRTNRPVTFGIAEAHPNYLRELFRAGLSPYLKAVTVHPYCGVPEAGVAKLAANRRIIREFGGDQEIWSTEIGFYYGPTATVNPFTEQLTQSNGYSLETQADQLARLYLLARAQGMERVYWYNFYGKRDRETYWMFDETFAPRPAYHTLKIVSAFLRGTRSLGGTAPTEPVQKQLYRHADGTVSLAIWSVRNNVQYPLHLPAGLALTVRDTNGQPVTLPSPVLSPDGKHATYPLTIGQRALLIDGLPANTNSYDQLDLIASAVDARSFDRPLHRWEAKAGATITIPCTVYNAGKETMRATPIILKSYYAWNIALPSPFDVAPGQTVTQPITVRIPQNSVPGVEYRLRFAVETSAPRRTDPFETRIWLKGKFPYGELLADDGHAPDYPMRRRDFDEDKVGFGRETITARRANKDTKVDGDLSEWTPAEFVTLDQSGIWRQRDVGMPKREEFYPRAALRWDDTHLYVAWIVLDDDLSILDLVSRDWRDSDNLRVFLSSTPPEKRPRLLTEKELLLYMVPTQQFQTEPPAVMAATMGGVLRHNFETQVQVASRVWNGGYVMEAAIPLSAIQITSPHEGMTIGCNLLADSAVQGFRNYTNMTAFKSVRYWVSPEGTLGTLRLVP